jgi:hypothetical protein
VLSAGEGRAVSGVSGFFALAILAEGWRVSQGVTDVTGDKGVASGFELAGAGISTREESRERFELFFSADPIQSLRTPPKKRLAVVLDSSILSRAFDTILKVFHFGLRQRQPFIARLCLYLANKGVLFSEGLLCKRYFGVLLYSTGFV